MIRISGHLKAHAEADAAFGKREAAAQTAPSRTNWAQRRVLNDHAYFVLVFAEFEQHVNDRCRSLVDSKKATAEWRARRPWDGVDLERTSFMNKVAMITDRSRADYGRIKYLYEDIRCKIAHGGAASLGPILFGSLAIELRQLSVRLKG